MKNMTPATERPDGSVHSDTQKQGADFRQSSRRQFSHLPKLLLALTAAYFLTSLGHFSHNAEFICEYPNLPAWLTRAEVYAVWAAITSVGVVGLLLIRKKFMVTGLLLMCVYAALGFDGLGHYAVAPIELHPLVANITILSEVAAAALLLPAVLWLLATHLLPGRTAARAAHISGPTTSA